MSVVVIYKFIIQTTITNQPYFRFQANIQMFTMEPTWPFYFTLHLLGYKGLFCHTLFTNFPATRTITDVLFSFSFP